MKVNQLDWHLTPVDPDPDFDPIHNQKVIDEVIRAGEIMAKRKQRESDEGIRERSEAVSAYLKSVVDGKSKLGLDKFFGNHELARLRGKEILDRLKYSDLGNKMKTKLLNIKKKYQCA